MTTNPTNADTCNASVNSYFDSNEYYRTEEIIKDYGHFFIKKTFHKPTYCHHCAEMLWGLIGQGLFCEVCNFTCHERCRRTVVSPCSSIASILIKNPVSHIWSQLAHFKRKFCNICRKRLDDSLAYHCEICDYFAHEECKDFAVSDCRDTATYTPNKHSQSVRHYHHWREGNLPTNTKCVACRKACWSAECLVGMRCEWCGITTHSSCRHAIPLECDFGSLKNIFVPPYAVSIPRTDLSKEAILGINAHINVRSLSQEFSSGDAYSTDVSGQRKQEKNRTEGLSEDEEEFEVLSVYDGDISFRNRTPHRVYCRKGADYQTMMKCILRKFHINEDFSRYHLALMDRDVMEDDTELLHEVAIPENDSNISNVLDLIRDMKPFCKRCSIVLRYKELDDEKSIIRVYPGILNVSDGYRCILISLETTVKELISLALEEFSIQNSVPSKYSLVESVIDSDVEDRILDLDEHPLLLIRAKRRQSLLSFRQTRFYLQHKEDPHGSFVSMFIGNLPTSLPQRQYEKIIADYLKEDSSVFWDRFDVIYYEYGAVVLIFNDSKCAARAFRVLRQTVLDDRQLLVLILPTIQTHMIAADCVPLLVFVNVRSGGQQGLDIISSFRHLVNPHQVFDLHIGGPLPGLYVFRNVPYYKVLTCGGDGTVGWVLSCLDNVAQDGCCQSPPMAIVPLGTGNDLARVLRWGSGYTGVEEPIDLLRDTINAEEIKLDRWTVVFHPDEKDDKGDIVKGGGRNEDATQIFVMNNYFSLGIDADICLDFHQAREENPTKFNSRLQAKGYYLKSGLRKMINKRNLRDFHKEVVVEVDGKRINLPPIEGIIVLNILSWGSGSNPWGNERDDKFSRPTHYDGMLEVVGLSGIVHLGQIKSGLRSGIRIAQGGRVHIKLNSPYPVQVDGEPWLQPCCEISVIRSALTATMLRKRKLKIKRRNTEPGSARTESNGGETKC